MLRLRCNSARVELYIYIDFLLSLLCIKPGEEKKGGKVMSLMVEMGDEVTGTIVQSILKNVVLYLALNELRI